MFQIIPSVILPQCCDIIQYSAIFWDNYLNSNAVCMKAVVLDKVNTTSVCSEVPSNLAAPLRSQIQWHSITFRSHIIV
jgi:hypothetical protein